MATYLIQFLPAADRQLRTLPREVQKRLAEAIDALTSEPRPTGVKHLTGPGDLWRIRVGAYRVVYTIEDDRLVVLVIRLGPRRDVYREL